MKKLKSLAAALAVSLMLASAVFAGEIQTPGVTQPDPTPTGRVDVSFEIVAFDILRAFSLL